LNASIAGSARTDRALAMHLAKKGFCPQTQRASRCDMNIGSWSLWTQVDKIVRHHGAGWGFFVALTQSTAFNCVPGGLHEADSATAPVLNPRRGL